MAPRRVLTLMVATAVAGGVVPAVASPHGTGRPACSGHDQGGAWPSYGGDATNSRTQAQERSLAPSATGMQKAWTFTTDGAIQSTPVVSHGCAFATTTKGNVYAIDVATGHQVWAATVGGDGTSIGGYVPGSPAVVDDAVIVLVSQAGNGSSTGPYAEAFDRRNGTVLWKSAPVSTFTGSYTNASAAVHNGLLVFGYSPPEGDSRGQGGVALIDAATGRIVKDVPTIPVDQQNPDHQSVPKYAGGGIWSTAAFDNDGYTYVGAGNPFSKTQQAPTTDAILKIDVDPARSTFGTIVDYHEGEVDQYSTTLQQLSQSPACAASDTPDTFTWALDDPVCGQLDLDFGASPNLFPVGGALYVGDLQKSGLYHAADTKNMRTGASWASLVGASCALCNAASTAYDGTAIYAIGTPGGGLWALDPATGASKWQVPAPVGDGAHYQSLSVANGVVYTVDGNGFLDAWSAADGTPLMRWPMSVDAGTATGGLTSAGVAIADHLLLAAASSLDGGTAGTAPTPDTSQGFVIAYH
jgi:outer membrane protein assembly factor BamB